MPGWRRRGWLAFAEGMPRLTYAQDAGGWNMPGMSGSYEMWVRIVSIGGGCGRGLLMCVAR